MGMTKGVAVANRVGDGGAVAVGMAVGVGCGVERMVELGSGVVASTGVGVIIGIAVSNGSVELDSLEVTAGVCAAREFDPICCDIGA